MSKRALILGVGGQDGSFCAELLLSKGYEVSGLVRRSSVDNRWRMRPFEDQLEEVYDGDLCDPLSVDHAIACAEPDEIYHFADQDKVIFSKAAPAYTFQVTVGAVANLLESARKLPQKPRIFLPCSATVFGDAPPPQNESTPFNPDSPYACAKAAVYWLARHYRRAYSLHICQAIFFNHDSERRGPHYLLQRIARGEELYGNLGEVVDIGYAPEYVEAAWKIMQLSKPDDYVIGTGRGYRISSLIEVRPSVSTTNSGLRANCSKANREFGFDPREDAYSVLRKIREGLSRGTM